MLMDEIHKLFIGLIAVLFVFTIMFGAVAKIQEKNQTYVETMTTEREIN